MKKEDSVSINSLKNDLFDQLDHYNENEKFQMMQDHITSWLSNLNNKIDTIKIPPNADNIKQNLIQFHNNLNKFSYSIIKIDQQKIKQNHLIDILSSSENDYLNNPIKYHHDIKKDNFKYINEMEKLTKEEIDELKNNIIQIFNNFKIAEYDLRPMVVKTKDIVDYLEITHNLYIGEHSHAAKKAYDMNTLPREKFSQDFWNNFACKYNEDKNQLKDWKALDSKAKKTIKQQEKQELFNTIQDKKSNEKNDRETNTQKPKNKKIL